MNCAIGWRAQTFGLSAFAAEEDDYWGAQDAAANDAATNQLIDEYWADQATTAGNPAKDESAWASAAGGFLGDLWKNVGQTALTNVIQTSLNGPPTGYVTTPDGKQVPYWGTASKPYTVNPAGQRIDLPSVPGNKWLIPAIIGGVGLLAVLFVVMNKRRGR